MRIAICGFSHETNMFGSVKMDMEQIEMATVEKEVMRKCFTGSHAYVGGYFDEAAAQGVEAVPIRQTSLKPSGPCVPEGVELCRDRIVELLVQANAEQPLDGIAMFMHGASAAERHPDIEGEFLAAIRDALGYEIPIGMALDLHGNITPEMVQLADLLIGCKEYPHIDEYDQGRNMFRILCDMIRNDYKPCKKLIKLPWLMVPAEGTTTAGAGYDALQFCRNREQTEPELIQLSFFQGFPYADVPSSSVSVVTMAKTQEAADKNALEVARYLWSRRRDFQAPLHSAEEAVDIALSMGEGPILINEASDNPGSGTPGDGTHLLRELLRRNVPAAFGFIYDPEVVEQAMAAGVGATISCRLGGKSDTFHGAPVELRDAYVKGISDGYFIQQSPMGFGKKITIGYAVSLVVGNVTIVVGGGTVNGVAGSRTQSFDDGPFRILGVDWQHCRLVAIKSAQHFKGWWADKVKGIVPCESPGMASGDLTTFHFRHVNKSYYPLGDAQWQDERCGGV